MLWATLFPRQGARQARVCSFLLFSWLDVGLCSDSTTSLSLSLDFPPIMSYNPESIVYQRNPHLCDIEPRGHLQLSDFSFLSGRADLRIQSSRKRMVVGRTWAPRVSVEQDGAELSIIGKRRTRCLSFR